MNERVSLRDSQSSDVHTLDDEVIMDDDILLDDDDELEVELDELDYLEEWCADCNDTRPHAKSREDEQVVLICADCNKRHVVTSPQKTKSKGVKAILNPEDYENAKVYKDVWSKHTHNVDPESVTAYSLSIRPTVSSIVSHPRFGLGVVCVFRDNKAEILFSDGVRRLVCGR